MQIYLISVLILAGSTLISFDITFLIYLFLYIVILNTSIIFLTYHSQDKEAELPEKVFIKIFLKTSLIPILAIPLTAFFFIILPRTDFPLFGFLNKEAKAKTGFSENVRLGEVSEIQENNAVIFRVKTKKLNDSLLYWRGISLNFFNGKVWMSIKRKRLKNHLSLKGTLISQTVYLEPYGDRYLFGLDIPYKIEYKSGFVKPSTYEDFTFALTSPVVSRTKYKVLSVLTDVIPETNIDKKVYLQLPKNLSTRIKSLAKAFKADSDEEIASKILNFLKYGEYRYSLKDLPLSENPLEDFLFKYKQGNCEYFASSMAILLRLNGIPSRLVAGYKGGIYNEVGGYYLIRESDAHVWVEAFIKGKGWVRYDPTPFSAYSVKTKKVLSKLEYIFETINYYYINFVLSYDLKKQIALFKSFSRITRIPEIKNFANKKIIISLIILLSLISFAAFLCAKYFLNIKNLRAEERLLKRFLKILEKKGYKREENEGLEEFILKIENEKLKTEALKFVKTFEEIYYKDKPFTKEKINELKTYLKKIKNL
jgi:transglutaminase-like putative cysteine protease